jgi:hypothetical protein
VFEAPIKGSYSVLEFEWTLLKNELFSLNIHAKPKEEHAEALEAFYAKVLQREEGQQGRYGEDMTFLISIYLCLVTSSVCCETGFSRCLSSPLTLCMRVRVPVVDVQMRQDGPHHDEAAEQPVDDHA